MKKGRHRRFEEARAMKRDIGTTEEDYAQWLNDNDNIPVRVDDDDEEDPYADLASKYADDDDETDDKDGK